MRRVDYVNNEPVKCFYTPVVNTGNYNDMISISKGDFVNFSKGRSVPISTYYYKYKENLLILDFDREDPLVHMIKKSKVEDTIKIEMLSNDTVEKFDQVIDIDGATLNIKSTKELINFLSETKSSKNKIDKAYSETKMKLRELIKSSDDMRELDKYKGTSKVVKFISEDNFNKIKTSLLTIYNTKTSSIDKFKEEITSLNSFKVFTVLSNVLEKELYLEFKTKNKEHGELLNIAEREADIINSEYNQRWYESDIFQEEKQFGIYLDCLNEMSCSEQIDVKAIEIIENKIADQISANDNLIDSYIDWVALSEFDKEDLTEVINETVKKSFNQRKKINQF